MSKASGRRRKPRRHAGSAWLLQRLMGATAGALVIASAGTGAAQAAEETSVAALDPAAVDALVAAFDRAIAANPELAPAITDQFLADLIPGHQTREESARQDALQDAARDAERANAQQVEAAQDAQREREWLSMLSELEAESAALVADAPAGTPAPVAIAEAPAAEVLFASEEDWAFPAEPAQDMWGYDWANDTGIDEAIALAEEPVLLDPEG